MLSKNFFKNSIFFSLLALSLFFTAAEGASLETPARTPLTPLISSVAERLNLADQVALYKWKNVQAIADVQREQQVLSRTVQQAAHYHLKAEYISQFFSDQIEANKLIQYVLFAQWHRSGRAPATPELDLKRDIRMKLDQLQTTLLHQLELSSAIRHQPHCAKLVAQTTEYYAAQHALDALHQIALTRALINVCEPS